MSWAALYLILKPYLGAVLTFILGWLFPSPLQKVIKKQNEIHDAEKRADDTDGYVDDLDHV